MSAVKPTGANPSKPSTYAQFRMLFQKNWLLAKRSPIMTAAEYFFMPLYCVIWIRIIIWVFPDDRKSISELQDMEADLNKVLPSACTFLMQTAFVPSTAAVAISFMAKLGAACGLDNSTTLATVKGFPKVADFEKAYTENPANYYACIKFDEAKPNAQFTILYNETLAKGRFLPNVDEKTMQFKKPPLTYVPALTTRGTVLTMGDNRLTDLTSKVQRIVAGADAGTADAVSIAGFSFDKPTCDGAGCVVMFMWPQMIGACFFITIQAFFTRLGQEKERGIKEALYLSGTSQVAYWGSWYASKVVDMVPPVVAFTTLLYATFVFQHQYFFVVLSTTFLFGCAFLMHVACVQAFLKTGMQMFVAGMTMLFFFSVAYYPIRLLGIDKGWGVAETTPFFLIPPIAASHLFWEFQEAESIGIPADFGKDPTLVAVVYMLVVDVFFWGFLAFYFEQIMPQAHGPALEPSASFICRPAWWRRACGKATAEDEVGMKSDAAFEGVRITGLIKEFASQKENPDTKKMEKCTLKAVDELSCDFPRGQVTAVLGHNGAGKTTTIRCMTASHSITRGTVEIDGVDVAKNPQWVRKSVGVCPQHDVLYDGLTAREHIELFGAMKGDNDVARALGGVDMLQKADELVSSFSGGQKRRLSVALALLGDPKLIVLDEPTTGMDVIARQSVWKMIEKRKEGRCIILTTHSMEEADALGDRVVVIGKGTVQAEGTSLELKQAFGIGFRLTLLKDGDTLKAGNFNLQKIKGVIEKHLEYPAGEQVEVLSDVGAECSFALPRSKSSKFPALFVELATEKKAFGIETLAMSQTTLEEVFLKLGDHEGHEQATEEGNEKPGDVETGGEEAKDPVQGVKGAGANEVSPEFRKGSFCQQVYGMMQLLLFTYMRNPMSQCYLVVQPIILVCITGAIYLSRPANLLASEVAFPLPTPPSAFPYVIASAGASVRGMHYVKNITSMTGAEPIPFETSAAMNQHIIAGRDTLGYQFGLVIDQQSANGTLVDALDIKILVNVSDSNFTASKAIAAMITNAGPHFSPTSLPVPTYQMLAKGTTATTNAAAWGAGGLMIVIAMVFAYLSALFTESMARDRVEGKRVHLFVSSMGRNQYYAGHFAADLVSMLVPLVLTPAIMACFGFQAVMESNFGAYLLLGILAAPSLISFGYIMSWMFPTVESAQEWGQELIGIVVAMPFFVTAFVVDASELAHTLLGVIPGYAFFRGLSVLESDAAEGKPYVTTAEMFDTDRSLVWVYVILAIDTVLYLGMVAGMELAETPARRLFKKLMQMNAGVATHGAGSAVEVNEAASERKADDGVLEEERLVKEGNKQSSLIINGIEQKFTMNSGKINHAVKGIFLGIDQGEVFGLLGMNGAGKTTLLHSIQGKYVPTNGDCTIERISAVTQSDKARELFGICPQHDVLWSEVTPYEHLLAFANIRGVPARSIKSIANDILDRLDIKHKAHAPSKTLSGGQKRKLSIAMAVIGNPKCVFLDEPTTGLDPKTRRFVWEYIEELKQDRVVVLTTHSMEEAEALCARIGIMVNGRLMTLGTPQQLKAAYGTGYKFILTLSEDKKGGHEKFEQVLAETYGKDIDFDALASTLTHRVFSVKRPDLDFGELFGILEAQREEAGIVDYAVMQSSMDEVFKNFARFQGESGEDPTQIPQAEFDPAGDAFVRGMAMLVR